MAFIVVLPRPAVAAPPAAVWQGDTVTVGVALAADPAATAATVDRFLTDTLHRRR